MAVDAPPRPRTPESGREAVERVRSLLARQPDRRASQRTLIHGTGLQPGVVARALRKCAFRTSDLEHGTRGGRPSPIWELVDSGDVGEGADRRLATEDQPSAAPPGRPPSPERHDPDLGLERLTAAIHARKTDSTAEPKTRADEPDSATQGETRDPTGAEVFGHRDGLNVSARTRKSIERAQAEERAAAALGDPPASRVFDLLRDRAMSVHELAGALGESHALIAEELHALKPWTIELHDGKRRAIERLRSDAA